MPVTLGKGDFKRDLIIKLDKFPEFLDQLTTAIVDDFTPAFFVFI